jgi:arylsulfatase A
LVQTELPSSAGPDSFSFLPVLDGSQPKQKPVRQHLVIAAGNNAFTIRDGEWKLINALGSGGFSKPKKIAPQPGEATGQLYDLGSDIGETRNLYLQYPDKVAELTKALDRIVKSGSSR